MKIINNIDIGILPLPKRDRFANKGDFGHVLVVGGDLGMASGGMGDALSGVLGGLLAQHFSPSLAAQMGVLAHALAADLYQEELSAFFEPNPI